MNTAEFRKEIEKIMGYAMHSKGHYGQPRITVGAHRTITA